MTRDQALVIIIRVTVDTIVIFFRAQMVEEELVANMSNSLRKRIIDKKRRVNVSKRLRIYRRDNYTCVYCKWHADRPEEKLILTLDHVIPFTKGGDNADANLVTACIICNTRKGDNLKPPKFANREKRVIERTRKELIAKVLRKGLLA